MMRLPFLLACAACSEVPAPASVALAEDGRLALFPADTTLVVSVDFPALGRGSAGAALFRELGVDPEPFVALAAAGVGVPGFRVGDARVGCGSLGCVALLEGSFTEDGAELLATALGDRVTLLPPTGALPGFDLKLPNGEAWVLRELDEGKAVFGERAAVHAVWDGIQRGATGLDPGLLAGRVPSGDVWVVLRDPSTLETQMAARAAKRSSEDSGEAAVHESFTRLRGQLPALDRMETVALALDASGALHARFWCNNEADAADLEVKARAGLVTTPGWENAEVTRAANVVEFRARPGPALLAKLVGGAK